VPPSGVWLVVGGPPPSDEAGCEGGGASACTWKDLSVV